MTTIATRYAMTMDQLIHPKAAARGRGWNIGTCLVGFPV
jgi:hypothetical protein